ncbi:hypothetical protein Syun_029377 [Stephania yunnanensis]|uniref:Uncharacterized protein n=1 Tax=Stephania yunnanensis TaxID=152371 RepID=A0AAP0HFY9_9MAGN
MECRSTGPEENRKAAEILKRGERPICVFLYGRVGFLDSLNEGDDENDSGVGFLDSLDEGDDKNDFGIGKGNNEKPGEGGVADFRAAQGIPLSLCILTHTLFTRPILRRAEAFYSAYDLAALIAIEFLYLISLFLFSILSTAVVVLSVASLYSSSKSSSSFSSLLSSALPRAFPRLARTFLFVSLLMILYNLLFLGLSFLAFAYYTMAESESYRNSTSIVAVAAVVVIVVVYFALHVYITAWWHLASELLSDDVLHFSSSSPP